MALKTCKICKEKFEPQRSFQKCCTPTCAILDAGLKRMALIEEKNKENKTQMKANIETHSDLYQILQPEINKIARLIDENCRCISCGTFGGKKQGSHFRAVGGNNSIRFNLLNIWASCTFCNKEKGGNIPGYVDGLIKTFGFDTFNLIRELKLQYPTLKVSKPEVKEFIATARKIVREIEEMNLTEQLPRTPDRRLELRAKYNLELNIYL